MKKNTAVQKLLISVKGKRKKYYVTDTSQEYLTSEGLISAKDLQSKQEIVKTDKETEFYLLDPQLPDLMEKLKRAPQIVTPKDIGLIIAKTGINKNSMVVDAGGGSASLSLALAHICKKVTCYEINRAHLDVVEKNKAFFGATNLTTKYGDIAKELSEKNLDLITLDLPRPWEVLEKAKTALKRGGFLVVYLPNLVQMKNFYDQLKESKLKYLETVELIQRNWKMEGHIMRPETNMVGHTGFMMFCRKL